MKESTQQIVDLLEAGGPAELFLIQNSWIPAGGEVAVAKLTSPDLIIMPSYYQKFLDAAVLDPTVTHDALEKDLETLSGIMKTAYTKIMGGDLQLILG